MLQIGTILSAYIRPLVEQQQRNTFHYHYRLLDQSTCTDGHSSYVCNMQFNGRTLTSITDTAANDVRLHATTVR